MMQQQESNIEKMPVREFRNNISKAKHTLAITNHGRTIGYYIPISIDPTAEDFSALKSAAAEMNTILAKHELSEDDIIADFKALRNKAR